MTAVHRTRHPTLRAFEALCRPRLALLIAVASTLSVTANAQPTIVTDTGTFTAVPSPGAAEVDAFFGIRYAAPPEGALRWQPPQAPTPPAGTVVAAVPGSACPQAGAALSEDCLFLNVYVPASAQPGSRLPVFFWIHGGSLTEGSGVMYDPSVMVAENNMIGVTINYRLGALGWLAEPGLAAASSNFFQNAGDAGNYGMMDQQFAMQWVQRNIAAFGGDPSKVTIAGESAGGLSVSADLASIDTAAGLFRGAIIESGGYMLHDLPSLSTYQALFGPAFDAALGCTPPADADCLRSVSATDIMTAQNAVFGGTGISPNSGTKILPLGLQQAFAGGEFVRVPILQGNNANEGRLFEPLDFPFPAGVAEASIIAAGGSANYDLNNPNSLCAVNGEPATCTYPQEIGLFLALIGVPAEFITPAFVAELASTYPPANFPDPFLPNNAPDADEALAQIFTDLVFDCNGSDSSLDLSRFVPVFAYEFDDPGAPPLLGPAVEAPNDVFGFPSASEHGVDFLYLFTFLGTTPPFTPGEQQLAEEMKTYWGNFVQSGSPNLPRQSALWLPFNFALAAQDLIPGQAPPHPSGGLGLTPQDVVPDPGLPHPFFTFRAEHFCDAVWQPVLAGEPQQ
jgi:para-nitrobenzyl esterase